MNAGTLGRGLVLVVLATGSALADSRFLHRQELDSCWLAETRYTPREMQFFLYTGEGRPRLSSMKKLRGTVSVTTEGSGGVDRTAVYEVEWREDERRGRLMYIEHDVGALPTQGAVTIKVELKKSKRRVWFTSRWVDGRPVGSLSGLVARMSWRCLTKHCNYYRELQDDSGDCSYCDRPYVRYRRLVERD